MRYRGLEAGPFTDKITTHNYEFTGGLKGNLGEFGDYFKTWNWQSGFRYSEDQRIERFGGLVDNNALRPALLDTDPATAFNPFGINQNSPAVIDKVFTTTQLPRHDFTDYSKTSSYTAICGIFQQGPSPLRSAVNIGPSAHQISLTR